MAVRIVTDTSAEYTVQEGRELQVSVVPMALTYGEESFLVGCEITKETFYHRLLEKKEIPVTSQPSPEQFLQEFEQAKAAGDSVVAILISSALSGTLQSAVLAKQICGYEEIYIVDSLNATAGQRILVEAARKMAGEGRSAREIAGELEDLKKKVRVTAVVDTLEYLYKGGRLSRAEAGLGTLANIKPLVLVNEEGKVAVTSKCIGRKRACHQLVEAVQKMGIDWEYPIYYIFTADQKNCENFRGELESKMELKGRGEMLELGPTIGTHIGGGAFGIAFVTK